MTERSAVSICDGKTAKFFLRERKNVEYGRLQQVFSRIRQVNADSDMIKFYRKREKEAI